MYESHPTPNLAEYIQETLLRNSVHQDQQTEVAIGNLRYTFQGDDTIRLLVDEGSFELHLEYDPSDPEELWLGFTKDKTSQQETPVDYDKYREFSRFFLQCIELPDLDI